LRLARDIRVDKLSEMTSDAFFAVHNPTVLFGGAIDLPSSTACIISSSRCATS